MIDDEDPPWIAIMLMIMLIALFTGWSLVDVAADTEMQTYVNASEEWCHDHGGELVNVQAIAHGGLHCEFDNGTSVHMSEVDLGIEEGDGL